MLTPAPGTPQRPPWWPCSKFTFWMWVTLILTWGTFGVGNTTFLAGFYFGWFVCIGDFISCIFTTVAVILFRYQLLLGATICRGVATVCGICTVIAAVPIIIFNFPGPFGKFVLIGMGVVFICCYGGVSAVSIVGHVFMLQYCKLQMAGGVPSSLLPLSSPFYNRRQELMTPVSGASTPPVVVAAMPPQPMAPTQQMY